MPRLTSVLAVAGALACAAGGLRAARARQRVDAARPDPAATAPAARWPTPGGLAGSGIRLGHDALAADVMMARAQIYFGGELEARAPAPYLASYLDAAVALDPTVRERYLRGAAMLVYSGPVITVDGVLAADRLLARGTRAFPEDWELWFRIGFDRLYELPRLVGPDDPRQSGWRREGLAALARAARQDGAPAWLRRLAAQHAVSRSEAR